MAKDRIEKTLIVLDEDELRQVMRLANEGDTEVVFVFMRDVIYKKVEDALRRRCG